MKKLNFYVFLLVLPLVFNACSEDDDNGDNGGGLTPDNAPVLVSELVMTETDEWGSYSQTIGFVYNDNKLITRINQAYTEEYDGTTYSGSEYVMYTYDSQNRPISSAGYDSEDDAQWDKEEFVYSGNKMEYIDYDYDGAAWVYSYKDVFEYDDNGQVVKITYFEYIDGQWMEDDGYLAYDWSSGNVAKLTSYNYVSARKMADLNEHRQLKHLVARQNGLKSASGYEKDSEVIMSYNSSINPFAYISLKPIMYPFDGGFFSASKNLMTNYAGTEYDVEGNGAMAGTYSYVMNSQGFPSKIIVNESESYYEDGELMTDSDEYSYEITYK